MVNKCFGYLGIAARARKIAVGETAYQLISSKKAKLAFLANDSSPRTKDRIQHICKVCNVPLIENFNSDELSAAIGQSNRMTIVVTDEGLAKQIKIYMK